MINQTQGDKIIGATIAVRNPLRNISSTHVFLPPEKLDLVELTAIAFSSVNLMRIDDKWRIVDSAFDVSKDTVRELAVRLRRADPSTLVR